MTGRTVCLIALLDGIADDFNFSRSGTTFGPRAFVNALQKSLRPIVPPQSSGGNGPSDFLAADFKARA